MLSVHKPRSGHRPHLMQPAATWYVYEAPPRPSIPFDVAAAGRALADWYESANAAAIASVAAALSDAFCGYLADAVAAGNVNPDFALRASRAATLANRAAELARVPPPCAPDARLLCDLLALTAATAAAAPHRQPHEETILSRCAQRCLDACAPDSSLRPALQRMADYWTARAHLAASAAGASSEALAHVMLASGLLAAVRDDKAGRREWTAAGLRLAPFVQLQKQCAARREELLQSEAERLLHRAGWLTAPAAAASPTAPPPLLAVTVEPVAWENSVLYRLDTELMAHCAAERRRRQIAAAPASKAPAAVRLTLVEAERELWQAVLPGGAAAAAAASLSERQRARTLAALLCGALTERLRTLDSILSMAPNDDVTRDLRATYTALLARLTALLAKCQKKRK